MAVMNWKEVEKAAKDGAIILLPTGVIEEHGPHLSLAVDSLCGYLLCKKVREKLSKLDISSLITPPFYWGINNATGGFPGSFTVRKETLENMIIDILYSLKRWQFKEIFIINWHGDKEHILPIINSVKKAREKYDIKVFMVLSEFDIERLVMNQKEPYILPIKVEPLEQKILDIHAGLDEVSVISKYFPKHVNEKIASTLKATDLTKKDLITWNKGGSYTRSIIPEGYFGNPADFSKDKGELIIEKQSKIIAESIAAFLTKKI
jgi:creatinine amidohydrolase